MIITFLIPWIKRIEQKNVASPPMSTAMKNFEPLLEILIRSVALAGGL